MYSISDFKIKKSKISGKGVFAKKQFKKEENICILEGQFCSLEEVIKMVKEGKEDASDPLGIEYELYLDLDEFSRTFNHSCNPNAFIRGKNQLIALRNIKKGEEITYDYSTTMYENLSKIKKSGLIPWTCKCNCASKNCRKIIDQFNNLSKEKQNYYLKNNYLPNFILKKFK